MAWSAIESRFLSPLLCAAVLAASAPSPAAFVQVPTMEGYPPVGAPATVTVVAPGAEPRRTLRYVVAPSYRASARMSMGMTMTTRMQGEKSPAPLPPMLIDFDLGVTAVHPDGSITYDVTFTSLDVEATGIEPTVATAVRTGLAGLAGLTGSATVSNRGHTQAFQFDTDRLTDPQARQALGQLTSSVDDLSVPLPEEAVGTGARWEARQVMLTDGVHVFQKTVFELESMDGPVVMLKARMEQEAPPQMMSAAGLPSGTKMRLDSMSGLGTATIAIRLDELVPTSHAEIRSSTATTLTTNGRSEPVGVDLRLTLAVAPTR